MECQRTRICICYLISTFLIGLFIYSLISNNLANNRALNRMREEMDEIAHVVLHSGPGGAGGTDSKQLTEVVDAILKKRLAGIWDDLYTVKKQMKSNECASMGRKGGAGGGSDGSLSEKREERVNYASEELGARIYAVEAEPLAGTNFIKALLRLEFSANPPVNMLRPSMETGSCFAFKQNKSDVTVRLAKEIVIESIELEHISKGFSPTEDTSSAPRLFKVYGLTNQNCRMESLLGVFEYENAPGKRIQLFSIQCTSKFRLVRFKFETNHGNPNYTCVYRIAVYGKML